jgi:alcohol dehydrogenase (cytochrome c)
MPRYAIALLVLLVILGGAFALFSVPEISWRLHVLALKASGEIEDLTWAELIDMLNPRSGFYVRELESNSNAYAVVRNPHRSDADVQQGGELFRSRCAGCHGLDARGGKGPDLATGKLKTGDSDLAIFRTLQRGIPGTAMVAIDTDDRSRWQLVAYLTDMRRGSRKGVIASGPNSAPAFAISSGRLENAKDEPQNWLTYSGGLNSWRYSGLDQINSENAVKLGLAWALQTNATEWIESSPIVVDGVMYLSEPPSSVRAIDALSGKTLWTYKRDVPLDVPACCGRVNRGVAVLGGSVFVGTLDAHLVALDAVNGEVLWDVDVESYKAGYTITAAPLAVRGKVVVGVSGGEYGIRGFIDAYDASSGKRAWRFYTVPDPQSPGGDSWEGDSWKHGGGPTWLTGSFDPALGLLYWGVGNPAPDFNGESRKGDNLFTNSVVALNVETGELVWHFQFTPHDEHDWDSNQIPVLVDHDVDGKRRALMLWANRNGFYYVLDRATGEFLGARAFVKQNWATEIDRGGRPVLSEFGRPTRTGTLTRPGASGGTNWWSPSYTPRGDMVLVPFLEFPAVFFNGGPEDKPVAKSGELFVGSGTVMAEGESVQTGVRALSPLSGDVVWEYKMPQRVGAGQIGGVLSTAGDVAFVGDYETFYALDVRAGKLLWRVNLGGRINTAPVSYSVDGRQMVVISAGSMVLAFALPKPE